MKKSKLSKNRRATPRDDSHRSVNSSREFAFRNDVYDYYVLVLLEIIPQDLSIVREEDIRVFGS